MTRERVALVCVVSVAWVVACAADPADSSGEKDTGTTEGGELPGPGGLALR